MELCWGDTSWAESTGAEQGKNAKTQAILDIGTDDPRNANLCSTNVANLPWMRILYFNDSLIRDVCAVRGFVDEIVSFRSMRKYIADFAGCAYQNPPSICAQHQMIIPRIIKG